MSLNWQLPEGISKELLQITPIYKGKEQEKTMHPILHRLIFLTMRLGCDLTKVQSDVVNRIGILRIRHPDLVTLQYDEDADKHLAFKHDGKVMKFTEYYPHAVKTNGGWEVFIDPDWIVRYWGLSTNATRMTFNAWIKRESKELV